MSTNISSYSIPTNTPIGSIIAWAKSIAGVGALGVEWQECNGAAITDPASPLYGQNTPNLNGSTDDNKRFLRGASTSGTTGGASTLASTKPRGGFDVEVVGGGVSIIPPYYEVVFIIRIK